VANFGGTQAFTSGYNKTQQGEIMKKFVLSALTITCLFALTTGLRADDSAIVAHVDQEFVAAGKTFPAGTYKFAPESVGSRFLTIRNLEGDSAFVLPMIFDGAAPQHAHLTLQQMGGVNYLSEIATPLGVYTLAQPRALNKLAKAKNHDAMSASGTN
jgi:hypothetical protein